MAKKSTRLETLQQTFEKNGISPNTIKLNDSLIQDIKKYADAVPDYRHPSYTRHRLGDIIMIVFFAILGNANEWGEIESFAKRKEKWLRRYLELPYGIPTDDIHEKSIVSIDGKESRGSKRKTGVQGEVRALQTLNVYSNDYGICLVQKFIEEKTNEILAAQEILRLIDL